jgi:putative peptidoglycan lipid II flippase
VVNIVGTVALFALLRRQYGGLQLLATLSSFFRMVVAGAVLAAVSWPVWHVLDAALGRSLPAQIVSLGLALAFGVAAYVASSAFLRVREMQALLSVRGRGA